MDTKLIERAKTIEADIQKAKVETGVHERQLKELLPVRKQLETKAEEEYGCKIDALESYKTNLEEELTLMVETLERDIEKAKKDNPEEN